MRLKVFKNVSFCLQNLFISLQFAFNPFSQRCKFVGIRLFGGIVHHYEFWFKNNKALIIFAIKLTIITSKCIKRTKKIKVTSMRLRPVDRLNVNAFVHHLPQWT